MSDSVKQQLSSCLDGELPLDEAAMLMKRLGRESETRAALGRYAAMGEAMRDGLVPGLLDGDFARRVSEEISGEELARSGPSVWRGTMQKWVAGSGIAAAVAAVALMSLQTAVIDSEQPGLNARGDAEGISYTVPEPPDRLNSYLVRHGSQAAMARNSSWTRVVTDQARDAAESAQGQAATADPDETPDKDALNKKQETP